MRAKFIVLFLFLVGVAITASGVVAQEGHPLTGVWYGDWGPSAANRTQMTVIMQWDGKAVTGQVDPGPDTMALKAATLDSTKWTAHLEWDAKDTKGTVSRFVADGKLENIGSYKRTLTGTYTHAGTKGDFKLTRD